MVWPLIISAVASVAAAAVKKPEGGGGGPSADTINSPWNQGDFTVNWGSGDVRTGDRTAPAQMGVMGGAGSTLPAPSGLAGMGISGGHLLLAGVILGGVLLWKKFA